MRSKCSSEQNCLTRHRCETARVASLLRYGSDEGAPVCDLTDKVASMTGAVVTGLALTSLPMKRRSATGRRDDERQ